MDKNIEFYSFNGSKSTPGLREYLNELVEMLNSGNPSALSEEKVLVYVLRIILSLVDKGRAYPNTYGTILRHVGYIVDGEKHYLDAEHVLDETVPEVAERINKSKTGFVREVSDTPIVRHYVGEGTYMMNPKGENGVYRVRYTKSKLSEEQCKELEAGDTVEIDGTELSLRKSKRTGKWYIHDSEKVKAYLESKE